LVDYKVSIVLAKKLRKKIEAKNKIQGHWGQSLGSDANGTALRRFSLILLDEKPNEVRYQCVKNQPYLTGFSRTVFATAKRRLQARIRSQKSEIQTQSLSGYSVLFDSFLSSDFLKSIDCTKRQRSFGHLPTFWAWLGQILNANSSCQQALSMIQSWYLNHKLPVPACDTSSYCKARQRVEEGFLKAIHERLTSHLRQHASESQRWNGLRLFAVDTSSVHLLDTLDNQAAFPQPSSQKLGCGTPVMGICGLVNLSHGGWETCLTMPHTRHESQAAKPLLHHLNEGDLLLGDRAFCTYEIIARSRKQGAHVLMRLNGKRQQVLNWNQGEKINSYERLVTWNKPFRSALPQLSREEWEQLPESMYLCLIKLSFENRAGQKDDLIVIELADLYARRWEIEVKLRDLKTTLDMETFAVKSPEMAVKTLWMSLIAYNLIRATMQRAGKEEQGTEPWELSFSAAINIVTTHHHQFVHLTQTPRKKHHVWKAVLTHCLQRKLQIRPYRSEPRAVKKRPKAYPLLTKHRSIFQPIPHQKRYSKNA
jgi:hypothetical protein